MSILQKTFFGALILLSCQLHAQEETVKSSFWDSVLTFFHLKEPVLTQEFKIETASVSLNYLTLPQWKMDHEKWGWQTNITYQIFDSGNFSQEAITVLGTIEDRTRNISIQTSDASIVKKAIEAHWLAGGLILLASKESIDKYVDLIEQKKISSLSDKEFIEALNLLTYEVLQEGSFSKDVIMNKNYKYIYDNLLNEPGNLFVVKDKTTLLLMKEINLKDLADLFQKKTFDPLLDFDSKLIIYDIVESLSQKGILPSDYSYGIIKQIYQMLTDKEQAIFRVYVNMANKEAINDLAFNLYFFSGLVDIGWNADILSIRKNIMKAVGTSVILKGVDSFSSNSDFALSLSSILEKVMKLNP